MNNILIVGGTASFVKEIIDVSKEKKYNIDLMTYRNIDKTNKDYNWVYLDIENRKSIDEFLNIIGNKKFDKIVITIGNTCCRDIFNVTEEHVENFYKFFLINYIYIMKNLIKNLSENGVLISISSRAANRAIPDIYYSAAKAGVQSAARSLSLYVKDNQSIVSIAPSLIDQTQAMLETPKEVLEDWFAQGGDNLVTKMEIAELIFKLGKDQNGHIIDMGPNI